MSPEVNFLALKKKVKQMTQTKTQYGKHTFRVHLEIDFFNSFFKQLVISCIIHEQVTLIFT